MKSTAGELEIHEKTLKFCCSGIWNPNSNSAWNHAACLRIIRCYCIVFHSNCQILKPDADSIVTFQICDLFVITTRSCDLKHPFFPWSWKDFGIKLRSDHNLVVLSPIKSNQWNNSHCYKPFFFFVQALQSAL